MRYVTKRGRRLLPLAVATMVCVVGAFVAAGTVAGANKATPIKIGFISTCKGPFAPFYDATLLGGAIAMIDFGGKAAGDLPTKGINGARHRQDIRSRRSSAARTPRRTWRSPRLGGSSSRSRSTS